MPDEGKKWSLMKILNQFILRNNRPDHTANSPKEEERRLVEAQIRDHLDDFSDLRVSDVMIPRPDIVAVPSDITLDELYDRFIESSLTRIPVYNRTPDEIIGFIHVKDFLPYLKSEGQPATGFEINKIIRKIIYMPRSTKCIDLLIKMRKETTHIAVIIDEYGGTEGLVMIELLIEQIIGDIRDEHDGDKPEPVQIHKLSTNCYMVDARASIEKVKGQVGDDADWLHTEDGEYETIGGFILSHLGRIPNRGEIITDGSNFEIEVMELDVRRIKLVKLTIIQGSGT